MVEHDERKVNMFSSVYPEILRELAQSWLDNQRFGTHLSHCNFGENAGVCKYGEDDKCPALSENWKWFGQALTRADYGLAPVLKPETDREILERLTKELEVHLGSVPLGPKFE